MFSPRTTHNLNPRSFKLIAQPDEIDAYRDTRTSSDMQSLWNEVGRGMARCVLINLFYRVYGNKF